MATLQKMDLSITPLVLNAMVDFLFVQGIRKAGSFPSISSEI
jgi:hypothetical protein